MDKIAYLQHEANCIPVKDNYLIALGRAFYNFTYLEWGIIWLFECVCPNIIRDLQNDTSGQIAKRFSKAVNEMPENDPFKCDLKHIADSFRGIVPVRDQLLHSNPYTDEEGEQRLSYRGRRDDKDWPIAEVILFAANVSKMSRQVGSILHGGLYEKWKARSRRD